MLDMRHHLTLCRAIGAQPVGDHALRRDALFLQQAHQQSPRGLGVATALDDFIEHVAVLIEGAPQPILLAGDHDGNFIEVPDVIATWLLAAQTAGVLGPELLAPATDRFIRDWDAALQQHFFDMPQAQRKPIVQPDRVGDYLRRKATAFVLMGEVLIPSALSGKSLTAS